MARDSQFAKMAKKPKFKIRVRNRCRLCGRPRGYLRKFQMCRICFPSTRPARGNSRRGEGQLVGEPEKRLCKPIRYLIC